MAATGKKVDPKTQLNMTVKTGQFVGIVLMLSSIGLMKFTSYFELGIVLLVFSLIILSYEKYWVLIL
jgi:hypothetical protein